MLEEELKKAFDNFNKKAETDVKLQEALKDKVRHVFIDLTDMEGFRFTLRDQRIKDLGRGKPDAPDIHITTDSVTMEALIKKEMGPMKALVTKRLKLTKISVEDLSTIKKLFS
jgi:putative sterol carrier protein